MSANRGLSGPSALNSRLTGSGAAFAWDAACFDSPFGLLARLLVMPARPFSRMMRATRLREVLTPRRRSSAKTFGAPKVPQLASWISAVIDAGSASRRSRARRPLSPRAVALPGHPERRAHLGNGPGPLVGQYELEFGPPRLGSSSCLLAKKALAYKIISFSLPSLSTSRLSLRISSAILNGLSPGAAWAASDRLTQSARPDGSTPSSRATSA